MLASTQDRNGSYAALNPVTVRARGKRGRRPTQWPDAVPFSGYMGSRPGCLPVQQAMYGAGYVAGVDTGRVHQLFGLTRAGHDPHSEVLEVEGI